MSRYEVCLTDGYGREIERLVVSANNLRLALAAAEQALTVRDSGHGERAVSASVDLLGEYACEVDESAGMRERALEELEGELQSPAFAAAMTAMDATLDALEGPGLPEGSSACVCGAVTHWQGEAATECLRCGRELLPPSLIPSRVEASEAAREQGCTCSEAIVKHNATKDYIGHECSCSLHWNGPPHNFGCRAFITGVLSDCNCEGGPRHSNARRPV